VLELWKEWAQLAPLLYKTTATETDVDAIRNRTAIFTTAMLYNGSTAILFAFFATVTQELTWYVHAVKSRASKKQQSMSSQAKCPSYNR